MSTFHVFAIVDCSTIMDFVKESHKKKDKDVRALASWGVSTSVFTCLLEVWEGVAFLG